MKIMVTTIKKMVMDAIRLTGLPRRMNLFYIKWMQMGMQKEVMDFIVRCLDNPVI